ncbi:VCBS repeat-containing protein [bacterium]|nr:VCBS repeat-containing protein [bacterium]
MMSTSQAGAQDWRGFSSFSSYSAGTVPYDVVVGDFNGDNIADLAVANATSHDLSILLGNGIGGVGNGTFSTAVNYGADNRPVALVTGDFDGDGIPDLAAANGNSSNVSVLLGNGSGGIGDGTFGSAVNYAVGNGPAGIATGDFDSDDIIDLVVTNSGANSLSVLLGDGSGGVGDGTFTSSGTYGTGTSPTTVATGDFNGDDITDLVVSNSNSSNVSVLLGDGASGTGDGTFALAANYAAGSGAFDVITGDFNDDGIADLAVSNSLAAGISVLLGNGSGGIGDGTFASQVIYGVGPSPYCVVAGDFDSDGIVDLAAANFNSDDVSILFGNGSGGVGDGTFAAMVNYAVDSGPYGLATGDFNGDGFVDLVVPSVDSDVVSILLNLGLTMPVLGLNPPSLNFGDIELGGSSASLATVLGNTGDADLLSTATLSDDGGGAFALSVSPISPLTAGTTTSLEVEFMPPGLGPYSGEVSLATNTSSGTVLVALAGTGVDTQAPTSAATGPTGSLVQASAIIEVTFAASDNAGGSGVASVELFYSRNASAFSSAGTFSSSPVAFDSASAGGDGTYEFYTVASDVAGNTEIAPASADISVIFSDTTAVLDWKVLDR